MINDPHQATAIELTLARRKIAELENDKRELLDALQEMTYGYIHEASMRHGVTREQVSTISPITRNAIDKLHKHGRLE